MQLYNLRTGEEISTHALTWSATGNGELVQKVGLDFNSRAHVERDFYFGKLRRNQPAFQLTRSRGARLKVTYKGGLNVRISTHALTWSATNLLAVK